MTDMICRPILITSLNKSSQGDSVYDFNNVSDQLQAVMTAIEMINATVNDLTERQRRTEAQLVKMQQHLGLDASLNCAGSTFSTACVYMCIHV